MITVVTWNIKHSTPLELLIPAVLEIDSQTSADVICLQEVSPISWVNKGRNVPKTLSWALGMHVATALHPIPFQSWWEGVCVLSRWPIRSARTIRFSPHRAYIIARVEHPDFPDIHVASIHLSANARRPQELAQLLEYNPPPRTILAGDFNREPQTAAMRKLRRHYQLDDCTYPTGAFGTRPRKLDSILITPDLTAIERFTLNRGPSDHSPVVARLKYQPSP